MDGFKLERDRSSIICVGVLRHIEIKHQFVWCGYILPKTNKRVVSILGRYIVYKTSKYSREKKRGTNESLNSSE